MIRCAPTVTCVCAALVFASVFVPGQTQEPVVSREYEIKAAYLFQFCRYVEWPSNGGPADWPTFVVGVLGPDVFGDNLEELGKRTVHDKKIVVHRFAAAKDYKPCHILFIAPDDMTEKRLAEALKKVKDAPVLIVSNTKGFARKGAIFNFFIEENKVKIEINPDAAKRAKLTPNPQLYSLPQVKIVKDAVAGGS